MNKTELVEALASKMEMPQYKVRDFINQFQVVLEEELVKDNGGIVLQGFGSFSLWKQTARMGRNPRTGSECLIQPCNSVKFKPGKFLLNALNDESL